MALVVVVAGLAAPAPAQAVTVFTESFDAYTAGVDINTTPTWEPFTLFGTYTGLVASSAYAVTGSRGAGNDGSARGSSAPLGARYTTGRLLLSFDLIRSTGIADLIFALQDSTINNSLAFNWTNQTSAQMSFDMEGMTATGHTVARPTGSVTQLHVTADIDLDTRSMSYSWFQFGNATPIGSATASWSSFAYGPNRIELFAQGGTGGFDNIALEHVPVVPEPSSALLLGLAPAVLTLARRRGSTLAR